MTLEMGTCRLNNTLLIRVYAARGKQLNELYLCIIAFNSV